MTPHMLKKLDCVAAKGLHQSAVDAELSSNYDRWLALEKENYTAITNFKIWRYLQSVKKTLLRISKHNRAAPCDSLCACCILSMPSCISALCHMRKKISSARELRIKIKSNHPHGQTSGAKYTYVSAHARGCQTLVETRSLNQ